MMMKRLRPPTDRAVSTAVSLCIKELLCIFPVYLFVVVLVPQSTRAEPMPTRCQSEKHKEDADLNLDSAAMCSMLPDSWLLMIKYIPSFHSSLSLQSLRWTVRCNGMLLVSIFTGAAPEGDGSH